MKEEKGGCLSPVSCKTPSVGGKGFFTLDPGYKASSISSFTERASAGPESSQ